MSARRVVPIGVLCSVLLAPAAQIPAFFMDSVVALGRVEVRVPGQPAEWIAEASGFLYGEPMDHETDPVKHQYSVYLVTNRHVIANHSSITMRINAEKATDPVQDLPIPMKNPDGTDAWFSHPNPLIDISVIRLNAPYLREHGLSTSFLPADMHVADRAKLKEIEMSVGDGVFVLGFPMGLSGSAHRNFVIARRGSVARISDALDSTVLSSLEIAGGRSSPL
jgi:S1-C subfamily serine protease